MGLGGLIECIRGASHPAAQSVEEPAASPQLMECPDLIKEDHPLHFYPGFERYAEKWNAHAADPRRMECVTYIFFTAQKEKSDAVNLRIFSLQQKVDELQRQKVISQHAYEQVKGRADIARAQKRSAMKRANRAWRRTNEELQRLRMAEKKKLEEISARQQAAAIARDTMDEEFALGLNEEETAFYMVDRLRNNPDACDSLLLKQCAKKKLRDLFWVEIHISTPNHRFFSLVQSHYLTEREKEVAENPETQAKYATRRQLAKWKAAERGREV